MTNKTFRLRLLIMFAILIAVAVGYFTIYGVGNISAIGIGEITLICPLGGLLVMIAERTVVPLAVLSIGVAVLVSAILGKIFCAWACPVHFMSRGGKRSKKARLADGSCANCSKGGSAADGSGGCGKSKGIKLDSRHGILAGAIVSTLVFGFPVFCLVCPIGLTFATVFLVLRLFVFGATTWTILLYPAIIALEILLLPKWCKKICPLGAMLSLMSGLNKTFRPVVNTSKCLKTAEGKNCGLCEEVCPEGINLHDIAAGETTLNDCSKCRACADICPSKAISFPLLRPRRDDIVSPTSTTVTAKIQQSSGLLEEQRACERDEHVACK